MPGPRRCGLARMIQEHEVETCPRVFCAWAGGWAAGRLWAARRPDLAGGSPCSRRVGSSGTTGRRSRWADAHEPDVRADGRWRSVVWISVLVIGVLPVLRRGHRPRASGVAPQSTAHASTAPGRPRRSCAPPPP
ncbi:hypothetical protein QJS66_10375 [Kocuria rhizophila]|nr:hypothetical protein QJS66_10375 [Kocuria rhizophila]